MNYKIVIYPSISRPSLYTVSVVNDQEEALVLGTVTHVDMMDVKQFYQDSHGGSWEFDDITQFHSLEVSARPKRSVPA